MVRLRKITDLSPPAADAVQRAALLEVRGRLRSARRKMQSGLPASRWWSAASWRALRVVLTATAAAVAALLIMVAAGVIASHAVSGFDLRTQVVLTVLLVLSLAPHPSHVSARPAVKRMQ